MVHSPDADLELKSGEPIKPGVQIMEEIAPPFKNHVASLTPALGVYPVPEDPSDVVCNEIISTGK